MTKQDARRDAAGTIALLIESYMEVGQPWSDCLAGNLKDHEGGEDCRDCKRVIAALIAYRDSFEGKA